MAQFAGLGDDDIGAIIAFLRSGHRDLAPDPSVSPPSRPSAIGKLILALAVGLTPHAVSAPIPVPPRGATVEYGRYVADAVYQCWYCHTPGFASGKGEASGVYSGGFALADPRGEKVLTANLTPDATGIGGWTLAQFERAVRAGVRPDGGIVRPPMPRMRQLDDVEVAAIYAYLRTVAPVKNAIARPAAPSGSTPAELFARLGCPSCHGEGAPHRDKLRQASGKSRAEVAAWIRNPQRFRPDTQMPTYAEIVDDAQAATLADWLAAGVPR
jgi:mono/diheme cytochrome c family protein